MNLDWPPRFKLDPVGGLRLLLIAVRDHIVTVDQAMECFTSENVGDSPSVNSGRIEHETGG